MNKLQVLYASLSLIMLPAFGADSSPACQIRAEIVLGGAVFSPDQVVRGKFVVTNDGSGSCTLPADLAPEGWLIQIFVKDVKGNLVYGSKSTKVEMTGATMQNATLLLSKQSRELDLNFPRFGPGNYVVEGSFSSKQLASRKIAGLPIGVWDALPVNFTISSQR